jgi:uncharacterized protein YecE (DUF72 family)
VNDLASRIRCGVAGWSYPDWTGYVYGPEVKDQLRFVADYVDLIEINNTFYRPPNRRNAESWVRRTSDLAGFCFAAKLHQDVTHGGKIEPAMVRDFHEGLAPMAAAGRLRHLLAQFRYDFADGPEARAHLRKIKEAFGDITNLTVEVRHKSWEAPDALEFLDSLGVAVAALDYPLATNSFSLWETGVGEHAYLRLHGRNVKAWFSKGAGRDETYNYLYSARELEGIRSRILKTAKMSSTLTVVANNHYQGKEMVNALQLKSMLTGGKVPVPPLLVARYPELKDIAADGGKRSLF